MSEEQAAQVEESAPSEVVEEQAAQVEESAPQEQAAEEQESAPVEEEVVVPDSVQARINTMAKQKHDALREKAELEQRLQQLEQQQTASVPMDMPKLTDPDIDYDDEKLAQKLVVYGQQEGMRKAREEASLQAVQQAEMQAQSSYKAKVDVFAKDKPDFEASVQQIVPILAGSKQVVDTIMALDNGPEVAYHLSKNPEALDSVLTAGVLAGARLGAISAQLAIKPAQKQTQAPPPTEDFQTGGNIPEKLSPRLAGAKFE